MTKFLKLVGPASYTISTLSGEPIQKGQVIRVSDEMAQRLSKKGAQRGDGSIAYHFTEAPPESHVHFDFASGLGTPPVASHPLLPSTDKAKPVKAAVQEEETDEPVHDYEEPKAPAPAPVKAQAIKAPTARRQRAK